MRAAFERFAKDFQARQEARYRLPLRLRILMPVTFLTCVLGLTVAAVFALASLHHAFHPAAPWPAKPGTALVLIVFVPFFGCLGPGGLLANIILHLMPPMRRALDRNAEGVPGASYRQGMRAMAKATAYLLPTTVILGLLGAVAPWIG